MERGRRAGRDGEREKGRQGCDKGRDGKERGREEGRQGWGEGKGQAGM